MEATATFTGAVRQAVKAAIAESGATLAAVSEGTGIAQSSLSRKLNTPSPFTVTELDLIARYLGVPVEQLSAPGRAA
jgi:lambda repressor-like predicted transcriptional regulator